MAGVKEIRGKASRVRIKRKNGTTIDIPFKAILTSNENELMGELHKLERWVEDLKRYHDGIINHGGELSLLWDDGHTRDIRTAITTCAEEIKEAIAFYEETVVDLTTLINAIIGTRNWLAANPKYNTPKHAYMAMVTGKGAPALHGVEISYP